MCLLKNLIFSFLERSKVCIYFVRIRHILISTKFHFENRIKVLVREHKNIFHLSETQIIHLESVALRNTVALIYFPRSRAFTSTSVKCPRVDYFTARSPFSRSSSSYPYRERERERIYSHDSPPLLTPFSP